MRRGFGLGLTQLGRPGAPWDYTPGAILDLDYVRDRYYGRKLVQHDCGRGSTAFTEDSDGAWSEIPAETPRRSSKGIVAEYGQTNAIRNNWLVRAAAGSPGTLPMGWSLTIPTGCTRELALATYKGLPCLDIHVSGHATGGTFSLRYQATNQAAAAAGQNWVSSAFMHLMDAGADRITNWRNLLYAYNASLSNIGVQGWSTNIIEAVQEWGRPSVSYLGLPANTSYIAAEVDTFQNLAGLDLDFTFRVGMPQLEQWVTTFADAPWPTSPIKTVGSPAARSGERLQIYLNGLGVTDDFTCVVVSRMTPAPRKLGTFVEFNTGFFAQDSLGLRTSSDGTRLELALRTLDTVPPAFANVALPPNGQRFAAAFGCHGTDIALSVNGGAVGAITSALPVSNRFSQMNVCGTWGGVHQSEEFDERIVVLPGRRTNTELQALSQLAAWGG